MKHRVVRNILGRDADHRKSLLKNLATSLVTFGKIETTLAKAKFVKPYVEKLITKAKNGKSFNNVKYLKTKLTTDEAVRNILEKVAPALADRKGGYTRIVRIGLRAGDNATMSRIEILSDVKEVSKKTSKKTEESTSKEITKATSKSVRAAKVSKSSIATRSEKKTIAKEMKVEEVKEVESN